MDAKIVTDLLCVREFTLVSEGGVAGNYEALGNP
jgi:hypothetical protein